MFFFLCMFHFAMNYEQTVTTFCGSVDHGPRKEQVELGSD